MPGEATPGRRWRTSLAVGLVVLAYSAWLLTLWSEHRTLVVTGEFELARFLDTVFWTGAFVGLPAVGGVLAVKRAENAVGWAILGFGTLLYLLTGLGGLSGYLVEAQGAATGPQVAVLLVLNAIDPFTFVLLVHILLFFPDGQLGRVGRWASRMTIAAGVLGGIVRTIRPDELAPGVPNPLAIDGVPAGQALLEPIMSVVMLSGLLAFGMLIRRYRRGDATERKQFQWILASFAVLPTLFLVAGVFEEPAPAVSQVLEIAAFDLGFLGFALALHRAIMKHRLFEIDRVVSRTVTYALVTAILVGAYLLSVVTFQAVLRPVIGTSDLAVALSTLAVAASFQPVRRRVQTVVDLRFSRARYDAGRTVERFGARVRDEVELTGLVADLRRVSTETVGPDRVVVWLAPRG